MTFPKFLPNFCQFGSSNWELNRTGPERTVLTCSVLFSSRFWLAVVSLVLSSQKEAKNQTELTFSNTTLIGTAPEYIYLSIRYCYLHLNVCLLHFSWSIPHFLRYIFTDCDGTSTSTPSESNYKSWHIYSKSIYIHKRLTLFQSQQLHCLYLIIIEFFNCFIFVLFIKRYHNLRTD